jgi:hypothetical protein
MAVVGSGAACSLVSGWSDLQDERPDAGRGRADAEEDDDSGAAAFDASKRDRDLPPATSDVACGAQTCTGGEGCCVQFGSAQRSCTVGADCAPGAGGAWLACNNGTSCPSSAPSCCLDFLVGAALCQNGCGPGAKVLCDPNSAVSQCPVDFPACLDDTFSTPGLFVCE